MWEFDNSKTVSYKSQINARASLSFDVSVTSCFLVKHAINLLKKAGLTINQWSCSLIIRTCKTNCSHMVSRQSQWVRVWVMVGWDGWRGAVQCSRCGLQLWYCADVWEDTGTSWPCQQLKGQRFFRSRSSLWSVKSGGLDITGVSRRAALVNRLLTSD